MTRVGQFHAAGRCAEQRPVGLGTDVCGGRSQPSLNAPMPLEPFPGQEQMVSVVSSPRTPAPSTPGKTPPRSRPGEGARRRRTALAPPAQRLLVAVTAALGADE